MWPAASPPGRWRWPTAAAGCGNGRHDPCASRRLVRARLLPQLPERAGDPWRAPAWEEAPLRPAAAAAEGGRLSCGRLPNRQGSLQMPPCTGSGVRSAQRFGTAAGWGLPRGAPQVVRFGRACGGGGRAATGGQEGSCQSVTLRPRQTRPRNGLASRSATPSRRTAPVAPPAWHQVEVPLRWCIVGLACRCSCRRRVAGPRPEPPRAVVGSRSVKPVGATACAT